MTPQPEPGILPTSTIHMLGAVVPVDRFILTGLVIVTAAGLAALYKWSRFGLATRAAAENEAAAMLGGLSPNVISLSNTLLASLRNPGCCAWTSPPRAWIRGRARNSAPGCAACPTGASRCC